MFIIIKNSTRGCSISQSLIIVMVGAAFLLGGGGGGGKITSKKAKRVDLSILNPNGFAGLN